MVKRGKYTRKPATENHKTTETRTRDLSATIEKLRDFCDYAIAEDILGLPDSMGINSHVWTETTEELSNTVTGVMDEINNLLDSVEYLLEEAP